jgi:hypothetical protein
MAPGAMDPANVRGHRTSSDGRQLGARLDQGLRVSYLMTPMVIGLYAPTRPLEGEERHSGGSPSMS